MQVIKAQPRTVLSCLGIFWLNLWFWSLFALLTLILGLVGIPFQYLFDVITRNRRRSEWLIRWTISHYGTAVIHSGWPLVRVKYEDSAPEEKPPFVFVANHRSSADAFLMAFLPFECVQVLNIWVTKLPLVNYLARIAGFLRVREIPVEQLMEEGSKLLAEGVSVIAFPEGTRSGSRQMGPFHSTAFRLAQRTGTKICPVAITGTEDIPRRGSLVLHPGSVVVKKLPSLTWEQYKGMNAYTLKMRVRDIIEEHLEARPA